MSWTPNADGLPHDPLINAGAITSSSLIQPEEDISDRFDHVIETVEEQWGLAVLVSSRPSVWFLVEYSGNLRAALSRPLISPMSWLPKNSEHSEEGCDRSSTLPGG